MRVGKAESNVDYKNEKRQKARVICFLDYVKTPPRCLDLFLLDNTQPIQVREVLMNCTSSNSEDGSIMILVWAVICTFLIGPVVLSSVELKVVLVSSQPNTEGTPGISAYEYSYQHMHGAIIVSAQQPWHVGVLGVRAVFPTAAICSFAC